MSFLGLGSVAQRRSTILGGHFDVFKLLLSVRGRGEREEVSKQMAGGFI